MERREYNRDRACARSQSGRGFAGETRLAIIIHCVKIVLKCTLIKENILTADQTAKLSFLLHAFNDDANKIIDARQKALLPFEPGNQVDIPNSGKEVEQAIRAFFKSKLPQIYDVLHGHLIDINGKQSPELDVIITHKGRMAPFFHLGEAAYVPIHSAVAIGEIKTTYRRADKPFQKFHDTLKMINEEMRYPNPTRVVNPNDLGDNFANKPFTFMLFADHGDYKNSKELLTPTSRDYLPNLILMFNNLPIMFAKQGDYGDLSTIDKVNIQDVTNPKPNPAGVQLILLYALMLHHLKIPHAIQYLQQIYPQIPNP